MSEFDSSKNDFSSAKQGVSLTCKNCGAKLIFDPDSQMFVCGACGSKFLESELEGKSALFSDEETFDEELKDYHCPGCGAEILGDENTATEFCVYCGSPVVFKGRVTGLIKPRYIIPFSISKEKAKNILKDYLKNYSFIPGSFFSEANLEKVAGIYYPFWEADCDTDSSMVAEGIKTTTWISKDREYTKKEYYDVYRAGKIHLEDITVNALKSADKKLIESVLPYPIKDHKDFKMEFLSGFHAKKNDLNYEDVKTEINTKIGTYANQVLLGTVHNYDDINIKKSKTDILKSSHDYVMLPVWVLSYKYHGKIYSFAVNGVTGKAFGEIPISKGKLAITFASVAAGLLALISLIGGII